MSLATHAVTNQSIVRMRRRQRANPEALPLAGANARQCDTGGGAARRLRVLIALAAALALSSLRGEAAAQEAGEAAAQEATSGGAMVGNVLETLHLRQTPPPAQDFVVRSRPAPDQLQYQPMKPTEKPAGKKTPAQLDALGAELQGALEQNRKAGARVAVPDPAPRPATPRRAAAAKPPREQAN
ncbi:MAG: hypothetical protein ABSD90_01935 [Methylocystis sp.]|jgi:hypothetical protein